MKKIGFLCLILSIASCGIFKKKQEKAPEAAVKTTKAVPTSSILDMTAKVNQLDVFEIGQSLNTVDVNSWQSFDKTQVDAGFFGFDGGGKALLYTYNDEPIAAILKDQYQQEIIAIVAIHPDIITDEKISVQASLQLLKTTYPEGILELDPLNDWYYYVLKDKGWKFVFDTTNKDKLNEIKSNFLIIH